MNNVSDKRMFYIDVANVLSALAVVILHTNGSFWKFSTERYWFIANIIESLFYFAVPIFLMNTGATLLDFYNRYSLKDYFKKRILKVVIPYVFWSLISILYFVYIRRSIAIEQINIKFVLTNINKGISVSIYRFFIALINVYLCIPLFAAVSKDKRKSTFSYLALSAFFINVSIPLINSVFKIDIGYSFSIIVVSGYLFYVIVGYLLCKYEITKNKRIIIYLSGIIGLLIHMIGTYELSIRSLEINQLYKGYVNTPCIMYSVSVYLLIKQMSTRINNQAILKIISILRKYTFSLYLLHFIVMDLLRLIFPINDEHIVWQLGGVLPITIIVCIISYAIRKLPFGKILLP